MVNNSGAPPAGGPSQGGYASRMRSYLSNNRRPLAAAGIVAAGLGAAALLYFSQFQPGQQPPQIDAEQQLHDQLLKEDKPGVIIADVGNDELTEEYHAFKTLEGALQIIVRKHNGLVAGALKTAGTSYTIHEIKVADSSVYAFNPVMSPDNDDGNVFAYRKNGSVVLGIDDPFKELDKEVIERLPYNVNLAHILQTYNPDADDLYIVLAETRAAGLERRGQQNALLIKTPKGLLSSQFDLEALVRASFAISEGDALGNIGIDAYNLLRDYKGLDDSVVILNQDGFAVPPPIATPRPFVPRRVLPTPTPFVPPTATPFVPATATPFASPTVVPTTAPALTPVPPAAPTLTPTGTPPATPTAIPPRATPTRTAVPEADGGDGGPGAPGVPGAPAKQPNFTDNDDPNDPVNQGQDNTPGSHTR